MLMVESLVPARDPGPKMSAVDLVRELHRLRASAADLGYDKVARCLDYAYWETVAVAPQPHPFEE